MVSTINQLRKGACLLFWGEYRHKFDEKSRLFLPSKLRDKLGQSFMLYNGIGECLILSSMENLQNFIDKIEALEMARDANIRRYFYPSITEVSPDAQGRIVIPSEHRKHAKLGLKENVVIVGQNRYIELWNEEKWDADREKSRSNNSIEARLIELGF